jgi:hypothetical protein
MFSSSTPNSWRLSLNIAVTDIIYIHYHQQNECSSIVLVGADGCQHAPIVFPAGQQFALQFLSCLEAGLYPNAQLDPPLWTQRGRAGKVFPRLKRKSSRQQQQL